MCWRVKVCEIPPLLGQSAKSRPHQKFRTSATFSPSKDSVNPCKMAVISPLYSAHYKLFFNVLNVSIDPFFVEFQVKGVLGGSSGRSSPGRATFLDPRITTTAFNGRNNGPNESRDSSFSFPDFTEYDSIFRF